MELISLYLFGTIPPRQLYRAAWPRGIAYVCQIAVCVHSRVRVPNRIGPAGQKHKAVRDSNPGVPAQHDPTDTNYTTRPVVPELPSALIHSKINTARAELGRSGLFEPMARALNSAQDSIVQIGVPREPHVLRTRAPLSRISAYVRQQEGGFITS